MQPLILIWAVSLSLAVASLLVFLVLIVRRLLDERRVRQSEHFAHDVKDRLFKYMVDDSGDVPAFEKRERALLRQYAIDLCHLVKGHERDRVAALLNSTGFRENALQDLVRGDRFERRTAALSLQLFATEESVTALLDALDDSDPEVRLAAADSLLLVGKLPQLDVLVDKLDEKGLLGSHDTRNLFRDIARREPSALIALARRENAGDALKLLLADALGEAADYSALRDLVRLCQDGSIEVRIVALQSLGNLGHPGALGVISQALGDEDWRVRAEAARSAGMIGFDQLSSRLMTLLDDDNWWVRFRAAEGLVALGAYGKDLLADMASNADDAGRMAGLILDEAGFDAHVR